jgi:hypothetical protein
MLRPFGVWWIVVTSAPARTKVAGATSLIAPFAQSSTMCNDASDRCPWRSARTRCSTYRSIAPATLSSKPPCVAAGAAAAMRSPSLASMASSTSSLNFVPPGAKILTPLSVHGLCDAVMTAAGTLMRCDQYATAGVGSTPRSYTLAPRPAAKASDSSWLDARVSRPTSHRPVPNTADAA